MNCEGKKGRGCEIKVKTPWLLKCLLNIWGASVRTTHLFLSGTEIKQIKKYVPQALREVEHLLIATSDTKSPIAFMGVTDKHWEMLFVTPKIRGIGIGRQLLLHGIEHYDIQEVTVNEQNPQAIGFYEHMGFKTFKRTDFDKGGNPYPLLYMKWVRKNASKFI